MFKVHIYPPPFFSFTTDVGILSLQACDLFLGHRGAILKAGLKRLRLEGKTVLYVRQLCSIFFHNLLETGREFTKAFPANRSCFSGDYFIKAHFKYFHVYSFFVLLI